MHKCNNCGTEFEGKFCPECGTRWQEENACPVCGAALAAGAKFCSECGARLDGEDGQVPAPVSAVESAENAQGKNAGTAQGKSIMESVAAFFAEKRVRKIYRALAVVAAAMCALFSTLLFLFCLAPYAKMSDIFTGGTQSLGNVYDYAAASSKTVIAFAAIGLALAGGAFLFLFVPKLKWREVPFRRIPVWGALSALSAAVYFAPFVAACVICSDVKKTDGGMGLLSVGAGPILIIVFALLFLVALGGVWGARVLIARRHPAFATEERDARAAEAEAHKLPVPDEKTKFLMRLRTALQWKSVLKWSIAFSCTTGFFALSMINGFVRGHRILWSVNSPEMLVAQIAMYTIPLFLVGCGAWHSRKFRLPSNGLQEVSGKLRKWFKKACIAYTVVNTVEIAGTIIMLIQSKTDIDTFSMGKYWLYGATVFSMCASLAVMVLEVMLSFCGLHRAKKLETECQVLGQDETAPELNTDDNVPAEEQAPAQDEAPELKADIKLPEERLAKAVHHGVPATLLMGLLLMTVFVVCGVGYGATSVYKVKKLDFGDPYTAVTRVLGNPDEGRDTTSWVYYSDGYDTSPVYRKTIVTFTADGFVTSVTLYEVENEKGTVIYENPKPEEE